MKQQMRAGGRRIVARVAPGLARSVSDWGRLRTEVTELRRQVRRLRGRVVELEREVQENRRLNRRLAELTDLVQELLVPAASRDEKKLQELLDSYAERL